MSARLASVGPPHDRASWNTGQPEGREPNLDGVTTIGGILHALVEQRVQSGSYALTFLVVGGLWLEPTNSWTRCQPGDSAAAGLLPPDMALTQTTFLLVA